jgi:hypothetical protein
MATTLRCRLGRDKWKTRGRADALTYVCQPCGKTLDSRHARSGVPPRGRTRRELQGQAVA